MQLVINIDDELYEIIKNPKKLETMYHAGRLCEAVRKGTPLPKGHGRLIDADKLIKDRVENDNTVILANTASTIIEADKDYEAKVITRGNCMMCGKEFSQQSRGIVKPEAESEE